MKYEKINDIVNNIKGGTIHTITYQKQLETRKGVTDIITKTTKTQVMLKTTYDNIKSVKEGRANGTLPAENQGLPKGTSWLDDRKLFIKNDTTKKIQLRCMKAHGNKSVTQYYKNGVIVDKSEVEPLCLKKEFPVYDDSKSPSPIFNIGIEKIIDIK